MIPALKSPNNKTALPLVVKVGGSLFHGIPTLVPVLKASKHPLVLIPGGGPFADTVRQCKVDNDTAHWMAVAAMEQYGWFIASHGIPEMTEIGNTVTTAVFLPYRFCLLNDVMPHTWDVSSDTIAACVAGSLHLDILLLKSVDGISINGVLQQQVTGPVDSDVTDPFFIPYVMKNRIHATIINGSYPDRVEKYLKGDLVPCTEISTTF